MDRILREPILRDLERKIVLLSGPRQSGKTTLAKSLSADAEYFNFDLPEHYKVIRTMAWNRKASVVIFDELHKVKNWKRWLKGVYDTEQRPPNFIVTGSAKMDTYRKVGDSLAGRYFQFRLHPFDLWELRQLRYEMNNDEILERLLEVSGYPEPFLEGKKSFYQRWRRGHLDIILRQDLLDEQSVRSIRSIEVMIEMLHSRVGSPLSYKSVSEDLDTSDKTVKRWIRLLEESYVLFSVLPIHKNIARSQKKAPKVYFYDYARIEEKGARFENLVACALLKQIHYRQDVLGETWELNYFRTKEKKEIDFILSQDGKPKLAIEAKWSDSKPSTHLNEIKKYFPTIKRIQLVCEKIRDRSYPDGQEVHNAADYLSGLTLP